MENTPSIFGKKAKWLLGVTAIAAVGIAVTNILAIYKNDIWRPTVVVKDVDYVNGVANLTVNGKDFVLRGDSTYLIAYDWGIKFGYTYVNGTNRAYDRIEVTKRGMVFKVIK